MVSPSPQRHSAKSLKEIKMSGKKIDLKEQMDACKLGLKGILNTGAAVAAMFAEHERDKGELNIMHFSMEHGLDPVQYKIIKSIVVFQKTNDIGYLYTAKNYLDVYTKKHQKIGKAPRWSKHL